jgi:Flp pilus assembly protein TadD
MSRPIRFGSAISLIALSSMLASCATPQHSAVREVKPVGNVGLATRALAALNSNDIPMAIDFGERAVAKSPNDAGFRALLGNVYFAAGRFASAESAYKDSLTIYSNQPQVVLKLVLVQIAQGKKDEAVAYLQAAQVVINPADFGLALALAGRPAEAIPMLEAAAREDGADARVRQNLALAYALSGDWTEARTIAAQDVPANQLDARIQQWMQLASPKRSSDQVASLVGVTPAVVDQGQPVQLALSKGDTQMARAAPAPVASPAPRLAEAAPAPASVVPQPQVPQAAPAPAPQFAEAVAPAPPPPRATVATEASDPAPVATMLIAAAEHAKEAVSSFFTRTPAPAKPRRVAAAPRAVRSGKSSAVVQIGAYSSAQRVAVAWNGAAHRYGALKAYAPMSARFAGPTGTFYRLSVKGFASAGEARALCAQLRRAGGKCFVRNFAGDAPVQYASR